ncbi:hypothetical protein APV28_3720 [Comamonas testosteroni]|nr:hypothetical protein APV28_3720 [Comamonas testosteroni]
MGAACLPLLESLQPVKADVCYCAPAKLWASDAGSLHDPSTSICG